MEENKKKNIKAGLITFAVHLLLFIILALLSISVAERDKRMDEDGVPVLLGMVEDAGGEDLSGLPSNEAENVDEETEESDAEDVPVAPISTPAPQPIPTPEPKPTPKPVITQNTEKSITAEEAKRKAEEEAAKKRAAEEATRKKAEEDARRKAEEAARKKAEEEARKKTEEEAKKKAAANSRVSGAFGNAGNKGSSGNTTGNGSQGSPNGNSNAGATTGTGGTGTSAKVGDRTVVYLAKPVYADSNSEGTVVVSIQVNPSGSVVSANVTSSTTSSVALKNAAIAAAKQSKFSEGAVNESGTITYRFKLQ